MNIGWTGIWAGHDLSGLLDSPFHVAFQFSLAIIALVRDSQSDLLQMYLVSLTSHHSCGHSLSPLAVLRKKNRGTKPKLTS